MEVPTQYKLVYLLSFLYLHQKEKVIVFVSNCEMANFLQAILLKFDWAKTARRKEEVEEKDKPKKILFGGNIFKLHGDMDHEFRKRNYFGFDKERLGKENENGFGSLLVCTDVASRGLDFKNVNWVVQYDLSSNIKEYVNRVGRTARIAT